MKELKQNELLKLEFEDYLVSDPDFNYSTNEFEEWLVDLVISTLS
jgi:hypothetical protein